MRQSNHSHEVEGERVRARRNRPLRALGFLRESEWFDQCCKDVSDISGANVFTAKTHPVEIKYSPLLLQDTPLTGLL